MSREVHALPCNRQSPFTSSTTSYDTPMSESPASRRVPSWLTGVAVVLVLLAVYVGGYFGLGEHDAASRRDTVDSVG